MIKMKKLFLYSSRPDLSKIPIDILLFYIWIPPSSSDMMLQIPTILMMDDVTDWIGNYCVVVVTVDPSLWLLLREIGECLYLLRGR